MEIQDYLKSDDLELVQLGVSMMSNLSIEEKISHLTTSLNTHFSYDLVNGDIYIRRRVGIWEQLDDSYKKNYNPTINLRIFEEAINNYLKQKDENQQWNV